MNKEIVVRALDVCGNPDRLPETDESVLVDRLKKLDELYRSLLTFHVNWKLLMSENFPWQCHIDLYPITSHLDFYMSTTEKELNNLKKK